ncbi:phosphohydrolase [Gordonia phage OneUp]|uniref:Uncharacterized protein n=1 Tax=Gordonia phage OneUp TaxID=1838074 RepID=A0A160DEW7_9CAUD|nr:phosphohydrolase [Gordonia phage OneUp]ANA86428.1 hypothetical protein PBI_ONEUP_94 [Gordonia phage OneUp]
MTDLKVQHLLDDVDDERERLQHLKTLFVAIVAIIGLSLFGFAWSIFYKLTSAAWWPLWILLPSLIIAAVATAAAFFVAEEHFEQRGKVKTAERAYRDHVMKEAA